MPISSPVIRTAIVKFQQKFEMCPINHTLLLLVALWCDAMQRMV